MAAINSLLFLLTTLAPNNVPFDDYPVTNTPLPEWNNNVLLAEKFGYDEKEPCFPDSPFRIKDCPPREHYERCGPVCPESCVKYTCPLNCCVEWCFCDEGYVRGTNGSCVRRDECFDPYGPDLANQIEDSVSSYAKECGPDEYISCDSHCQKSCSNYLDNIPCPGKCKLDCVCIPPKIRGPDGNCILPQECVSTSLTPSDDNKKDLMTICNFLHIMNPKAPRCPMIEKQCNNPDECFSGDNEGYLEIRTQVDDEREPCFPDIPLDHMECPPGEHYEQCGDVCLKSCIEYDCPLKCCVEGCFCEEGYVRGPNSDCIPKEQCPPETNLPLSNQIGDMHDSHAPAAKVCGLDEIISCTSHCQKNCSNLQDIIPCPNICVLDCVCKLPKIRGPKGDCILLEQCSLASPQLDEDIKRAMMISNFLRIRENVPEFPDAHSMKGQVGPRLPVFRCQENEFLSFCTSRCPDACDNYQDKSRSCNKVCIPLPNCACKEGFVRGPNGDCITPQECPMHAEGPRDCPVREYFDTCGPVCEDDCASVFRFHSGDHPCLDKSCKEGCFCRPGFVRGNEGRCIWPILCYIPSPEPYEVLLDKLSPYTDEAICPENEEWQFCGTECPKNCTNYDKDIPCTSKCSVGCFCKDPRVRGPDGKCILTEECPLTSDATCPENEEWRSCGPACPKDCFNYDKDIPCVAMCSEGCFCKEPMVRDPYGKCVLIEECPQPYRGRDECRENEYFADCHAHCEKNCTNYANYDEEVDCFYLPYCIDGCVCKPPLVRGPGPKFLCLDPEECPEPVREDSDVTPAAPVCPENEYFDECGTGCPKNCTNYNTDLPCSRECVPGCFCENPLVRGPNGDCIAVQDCPMMRSEEALNEYRTNIIAIFRELEADICKENERLTTCKSVCPDTCNNYNEDRLCKHLCLPGCSCLPGYVISRNGVCVKKEHCVEDRPEDCSELEVYNECGSHCETDCFNHGVEPRQCYTNACRKGCFCKPGWVRSRDMKCIRPHECQINLEDIQKGKFDFQAQKEDLLSS